METKTCHHEFRYGLTMLELMVVILIVGIVSTFIITATSRMRGQSLRTQCAANLAQLGKAIHNYAAENRGYLPRYSRNYYLPGPVWIGAIPRYLGAAPKWTWADQRRITSFMCPSHPLQHDAVPSHYTMNCLDFSSAPNWKGAPPTPLSAVSRASSLPLLVEASDQFGQPEFIYPPNAKTLDLIFEEPFHVLSHTNHLPDGARPRMTWKRHMGTSANVLFADGHVESVKANGLPLDAFDDGVKR